jgi:NAD-dependent SIR2 family protein deacetylase
MSLCAHRQSDYQIAKLPKCKKCKSEMMLVAVVYENLKGYFWEWECCKCSKSYPGSYDMSHLSTQDKQLALWCKNEYRQEYKKDSRKNNKYNK